MKTSSYPNSLFKAASSMPMILASCHLFNWACCHLGSKHSLTAFAWACHILSSSSVWRACLYRSLITFSSFLRLVQHSFCQLNSVLSVFENNARALIHKGVLFATCSQVMRCVVSREGLMSSIKHATNGLEYLNTPPYNLLPDRLAQNWKRLAIHSQVLVEFRHTSGFPTRTLLRGRSTFIISSFLTPM